jgi:hypothetical protein
LDSDTVISQPTKGIRKSLLLIRFVEFIEKKVDLFNSFAVQWVDRCLPAGVTPPEKNDIQNFIDYYQSEMPRLQDPTPRWTAGHLAGLSGCC